MLAAMHTLLRRAQALALSGLLIAAAVVAWPAAPVRGVDDLADAPADIPGLLWTGGSIASSVGGTTFDRVWRLELEVGRVAVVNLAGSSGSQLGLYLFDEFAGSVSRDEPIAQSAKAGGSQKITAVLQPGTYYVNVNGRNTDRAYAFTLSVVLLPDTTPPTLTLRPAPDGAAVNSTTARVLVLGSDLLSGVATMRFRVDGGEWGEWEPASAIASVEIPDERGTHRIEGQVTNGLGLVSATASTSVLYDDIAPTSTRKSPRADGSTTAPRPTIVYQFDEPMRASSWINGGLVVLTRGGGAVDGTFTYDATTRTGRWTPTYPLDLGAPYAVQLGGVVDAAGNRPVASDAWVLQYQLAAKIAVDATPVRTTYETLRTIIGTLTNVPAGAVVYLEQQLPGGAWTEQATLYAPSSGPLRATFRPTQSASWRLRYDGDAAHRSAVSAAVSVKVTARLTLSGAGGYVRVRSAGATVQLRGTATPASSVLTLVRYRCNSLFTGCVVSARIPVVADSTGTVTYAWKATRGYWIWKLKSAAGAGLEAGTTGRLRFTVR